MSDNVYRVTEIVGSSTTSTDDAIKTAIARANKSLRNVDWFEVIETRDTWRTESSRTSRSP